LHKHFHYKSTPLRVEIRGKRRKRASAPPYTLLLPYVNRPALVYHELGASKRMRNIRVYIAVCDHRLHQTSHLHSRGIRISEREAKRYPLTVQTTENQSQITRHATTSFPKTMEPFPAQGPEALENPASRTGVP